MEESHKSMTICPPHGAEFGIRWRCSKVRCSVPTEIAAHKTETVKGDRRLDGMQSECILRATGKLVPVGSHKLNVVSFCNKHLLDRGVKETENTPHGRKGDINSGLLFLF